MLCSLIYPMMLCPSIALEQWALAPGGGINLSSLSGFAHVFVIMFKSDQCCTLDPSRPTWHQLASVLPPSILFQGCPRLEADELTTQPRPGCQQQQQLGLDPASQARWLSRVSYGKPLHVGQNKMPKESCGNISAGLGKMPSERNSQLKKY